LTIVLGSLLAIRLYSALLLFVQHSRGGVFASSLIHPHSLLH